MFQLSSKTKRGKLVCQQLKNYDNTNKLNGSNRVRMKSSKTSCGMSTHAVFITVSQIPAQCAPNFLEVAVQTESTILQPSEPNLKVVNQQFQLVVALEKALLAVKPYRKVVSDIAANDDKIRCYTGLASHAVFHSLLECMQPKVEVAHSTHSEPEIGRKMKLTCEEQFVTVTVLIQLSPGVINSRYCPEIQSISCHNFQGVFHLDKNLSCSIKSDIPMALKTKCLSMVASHVGHVR